MDGVLTSTEEDAVTLSLWASLLDLDCLGEGCDCVVFLIYGLRYVP